MVCAPLGRNWLDFPFGIVRRTSENANCGQSRTHVHMQRKEVDANSSTIHQVRKRHLEVGFRSRQHRSNPSHGLPRATHLRSVFFVLKKQLPLVRIELAATYAPRQGRSLLSCRVRLRDWWHFDWLWGRTIRLFFELPQNFHFLSRLFRGCQCVTLA